MKGFKKSNMGMQSGHSFPASFGFKGSASKSGTMCKADGGRIIKETANLPAKMSSSSDKGNIIGESSRPFRKGGVMKKADGGHVTGDTQRLPAGESSSSDKGNVIGESTRAFKKGGKTKYADGGAVEPHTMPPHPAKNSAPHGDVNFADYKKGGMAKSRGGKK